ncbi:MAG: hypothetical protein JW957_03345 [Candidatus Omnitrophica bacterium]|nr:hypothetical protein [Candidatus Omnitrophota bacterium]
MQENKSIVVFHQFIIPIKETILLIEDLMSGFPGYSIYFYGNRRHLTDKDIDTLENIIPEQNFLLYDAVREVSKIQSLFRMKKRRLDIGVIPVFLSKHSFPTNYRRVSFIALCNTRRIFTYDIEKRELRVLRRTSFVNLLWYDFFMLCLLIVFFPATFILLGMLAYNHCMISKNKRRLYI